MQVSVENISPLERMLTISVPGEALKTEENNRLRQISKEANLKGFRRGKVPLMVVKKQFGQKVRQEAIQDLIEKTLTQALKQEKLTPVMMPKVHKLGSDFDQNLKYSASFEVFPDIKMKDYSEILLEQPVFKIQDSDIKKALEKMQEHLLRWEPVEEPATKAHKVQIDYESTIDGKTYEYSSAEDVPVELGSNKFLPGFEEKLMGVRKGDTVSFSLRYPKDWGLETVADQEAVFKVQVRSVLQKNKPPLDQAFAREIGATGEDEASIFEKISDNLEYQIKRLIHIRQQEALLTALIAQNSIELPKSLLAEERAALQAQWEEKLGKVDKLPESMEKKLQDEVTRRVSTSLLLKQVVEQEKIDLDQEAVKSKFIESIQSRDYDMNSMNDQVKNILIRQAQNNVLIDQAVELLLKKVTLTEKKVSVETILTGKWSANPSDVKKEA